MPKKKLIIVLFIVAAACFALSSCNFNYKWFLHQTVN